MSKRPRHTRAPSRSDRAAWVVFTCLAALPIALIALEWAKTWSANSSMHTGLLTAFTGIAAVAFCPLALFCGYRAIRETLRLRRETVPRARALSGARRGSNPSLSLAAGHVGD